MTKGEIFQDPLNTQRFITKRISVYVQKLQHLAGEYWPDTSPLAPIYKEVAGADIIQMTTSEPLDLQTPDLVKEAAKKYLDENVTLIMGIILLQKQSLERH